ncbi:MAG TPA: GerMN domain-containing protein [Candidatus Paceibacterota bacterium]
MNRATLGVVIVLLLILGTGGYLFFAPNRNPVVPETESGQEQTDVGRTPGERTVNLFYYNPALDLDAEGNVMCTDKGLVPVSRKIASMTPIEETIRLLLSGSLTAEERARGITTEYPLPGVSLRSVVLSKNGELRIVLDDPQHRTGGGSCRVTVLWAQIRATALQFPEVHGVSFQPEELFQP